MAAPSSAAHDRLGRTRNSATAIIAIRITSFVIFMISFPFQNLSCLGCSSALKLGNLADEFRDWIRTYRVSTDNGVSVSDCGHGGAWSWSRAKLVWGMNIASKDSRSAPYAALPEF